MGNASTPAKESRYLLQFIIGKQVVTPYAVSIIFLAHFKVCLRVLANRAYML